MLIGVLSDTHGVLPQAAYNELADCDHIIHAGDICGPHILTELRMLAPVTAVLGNNDFDEYGSDVQVFATPVIGGVHFLVTHYPNQLRSALLGRTKVLQPGDSIPDVAIHGHTHVPELLTGADAAPAGRILCPGSTTHPRGGSKRSIAKILIEDGVVKRIYFVTVGSGWF